MRKNIISIIGCMFCAGLFFLASCTKQDHFYKDYIIERTYIGRPDSIWVQPGDQRVQIGWLTPKHTEARDMVIRYGADSVIVAIDHDVERQTFIVENLEERDYVFNVYTSDRLGNRSVPMELNTEVYGETYRSTLRDMGLSHSVVFTDSIALLWSALQPDGLLTAEVEFTNRAGVRQQILVSVTADITVLDDADPNEPVSVRSAYLPHENAFEYMYAERIVDLVATKRNSITFSSAGYLDAVYVDFNLVRGFSEADARLISSEIDMCYALGAGSRGNLFSIDGTGFGAFAMAWQTAINGWPVRNYARLKLDRTAGAGLLYDSLDDTNRSQMVAAYTNSSASEAFRLSGTIAANTILQPDDIIFLHSADRGIYVAMKVTGAPPAVSGVSGDFTIEFKISRP